jgi:hypothetical protein
LDYVDYAKKIISISITIILISPIFNFNSENSEGQIIGTIDGEIIEDNFGFSVAHAGDVNGDGIADIIVGAPGFNNNTGRAYIFYGGPQITDNLAAGNANVTIMGEEEGDRFGWDVSGAGDVNKDGFDDVIVGAPGYDNWENNNWSYRKKLIFNNSGQSENLINFPVLVKLSSSNFDYSKSKPDGSDLRFFDADDSTELKYHIEEWNPLGYSYIWVNVTKIDGGSSTDHIWMYYGNLNAIDVQDIYGTYDDNFKGVWHLNESGNGNTGEYKDSTANKINGTGGDGASSKTPIKVKGKIGSAQDFDGQNDIIHFGTDKIPDMTYYTITSWVNLTLDGSINYAVVSYENLINPFKGISLYVQESDGAIGIWYDLVHNYSINNKIKPDNWAYLALRGYKHPTSGYVEISLNGGTWETILSGNTNNLEIISSTPLVIGGWPGAGPTCYTKGIIDEVRISDKLRSSDWIKAQYISMNDSFITFSNEELKETNEGAAYIFYGQQVMPSVINAKHANITLFGNIPGDEFGTAVSGAGDVNQDSYADIIVGAPYYDDNLWNTNWSYRKKLVFNNSGQSQDLLNFPVLINLNLTNFNYSKAKPDGSDLRFIDNDGSSELNYHIEHWNSSGTSQVWVNVTEISASSSTDYIWMYYGNLLAPDVQDESGTYDDNFMGVWHLKEDAGGFNSVKDSTSNNNDGTNVSNPNFGEAGKIGKAVDLSGSEYITVNDSNSLDIAGVGITISAWIAPNFDNTENTRRIIVDKRGTVATDAYRLLYHDLSGEWRFMLTHGAVFTGLNTQGITWSVDEWHFLAATYDGSSMKIYWDGIEENSILAAGDITTTDFDLGIGAIIGDTLTIFNGTIDEVRISNTARSLDWIKAQYLSMTNNFVFNGKEETKKENFGAAYIFYGGNCLSARINASEANFTISGLNDNDNLGFSVADAGDTDNDGYDDVVIGAPGSDKVYIFSGGSSLTGEPSLLQANVTISGTPGDGFGRAVSGCDDINGDSYADIIIGAPLNNSQQGTAYVFFGTDWSSPKLFDASKDAKVTITGESSNNRFGYAVSSAGNFNGDSFNDIIIGAPDASGNGSVYVIYGNTIMNPAISAGDADYKITGKEQESCFGWSVSEFTDLNDSYGDYVIVGAPFLNSTTNSGKAHLLHYGKIIDISWVKTYDQIGIESNTFTAGDSIEIKANLSSTLGSDTISGANITITAPDKTIIVNDEPMDLDKSDPGDPSLWKLFDYTSANSMLAGTYTINVFAISAKGTIINSTITFTVEPGLPDSISVTPNPSSIIANGVSSSNITISAFDEFGNPVPGLAALFITNLDEGGGTFGAVTGYGNGVYNATFISPTKAAPDAVINISLGTIFKTTTIDLLPGLLNHIEIIPATIILEVGENYEFIATGFDVFNNIVDLTGTVWTTTAGTFTSENASDASFKAATSVGKGYVNASVGAIIGSAEVDVIASNLARIVVSPVIVDIVVNDTLLFTATGYDKYDNIIELTTTRWSTDIGELSDATNSKVNLKARLFVGSGYVKASQGAVSGTADVNIIPDALHHIIITPDVVTIAAGMTQNFSAKGYDKFGNEISTNPIWQTNVGTMDGSMLTAQTISGSGYVKASSGAVECSAAVNIIPDILAKIVVIPDQIAIEVGKTQDFTALGYDQYNNVVSIEPEWSTDVGEMTASRLTAQIKTGNGFVNATVSEIRGSAVVTIMPGPLHNIVVTPDSVEIIVGETLEFEAAGYDHYGNIVSIAPIWYSSVGAMTQNIFSAGTKVGIGVVTATYAGINGISNVTIIPRELNNIIITPPVIEVIVGGTHEFYAVGYDIYNNIIEISPQWSTDVGTMTGNVLSAQMLPGEGTVTAAVVLNTTSEEIKGHAEVSVILGDFSGRPMINSLIPDQDRFEDCEPWVLYLTPFESDLKDTGPDLKWYVTGENNSLFLLTGEYSDDDVLKFTPIPDAYGNNEITLWLMDSDGYLDYQTIWVNLTPVNDGPTIFGVPDLFVHYDSPYTFNYAPYVNDMETPKDQLIISTFETTEVSFTEVSGLNVTFNYPEAIIEKEIYVTIIVTDGEEEGKEIIKVTVSDDWVPNLREKLPDITLYEGSALINVFDLDDYFSDPDGDSLYYSYGETHIEVKINRDHTVDVASTTDWSGVDIVTFRAEDPIGALAEDTIKITVLPVNDPPNIDGIPDLIVHYDYDFRFNLKSYIHDNDNDSAELTLYTSDPMHIQFDNNYHMVMIINYPESENGKIIPITITVFDGLDSNSQLIKIKVTDDFPPEINTPIPDVEFEEDEELDQVFDLDYFFFDLDGDSLYYTYGHTKIDVKIHDDNTVSFSATENWYGSEEVTFRALDIFDAFTEDTIIVRVIPVNDAPVIEDIPAQKGKVSEMWVLDLSPYLDDIDNDISDLEISVESELVVVSGLKLAFYSDYSVSKKVTVHVSDGDKNTTYDLQLSFGEGETVIPLSMIFDWSLILILLIIVICFAVVYRKYRGGYKIEEVFLIYEDGILITHKSNKTIQTNLDDELVSSMLTVVLDFVKDSFVENKIASSSALPRTSQHTPKIEEWQLQQLNLEGHSILIEHGTYSYLAVIFSGSSGWKLNRQIMKTMKLVESKYSDRLRNWKGNMKDFDGVERFIYPLIDK